MEDSKLNTERHIKYWQRCLKTLLPTQYTSTDSSRMSLGFFILAALDLLGVGADTLPAKEQKNIRDWILKCQHPNGGFCGSPNHTFPESYYVDVGHRKEQMDPANLPATCFALLSLSLVGTFDQVKRVECLRWLRTLQREDGSFGELVTQDGKIQGGKDMRYCFVAVAIRWILRGEEDDLQVEDIDVEKLVGYLRDAQTYDGGISESSAHEAHAGYTYCAISSLGFLNRLPDPASPASAAHNSNGVSGDKLPGLTNISATIRWLVSRQIEYTVEEEDEDNGGQPPFEKHRESSSGTYRESTEPLSLDDLSLHGSPFVGFNGRCNKRVDTCYAFWVTASLDMLGKAGVVDYKPIRRFLLDQTQHQIGGFGKAPGDRPDIYHSYLGLAALATMKEPALKTFDPALCISAQQREKIVRLRREASVGMVTYWKHGYRFSVREHEPECEKRMATPLC